MSKMGISTIQSYRGAQIFEAIGLNEEFVDRYFDKTASRIGGVGLEEIAARDALPPPPRLRRPRGRARRCSRRAASTSGAARASSTCSTPRRSSGSSTRPGRAATTSSRSTRRLVDEQNERLCTLRGLFDFKLDECQPIPIEEVEPVEAIVKRFATGAMSLRLDQRRGARDAGHRHEPPRRQEQHRRRGRGPGPVHRPMPNGDSRRSAIKQVASGRFGVTSEYLVNADELQIKMAQGAKPGEGGQLPGHKVWPWIAKVRLLDAGRRPDQPAAAPRHLLDRGPGPADPRPEERQPAGADQRQAGGRGRRRHGRRRASPRRTATSS